MNFDPDLGQAAIRLAVNLLILGSSVAAGLALAFRLTRLASPRARYLIAVMAFSTAILAPMAATFYSVRDRDQVPPIATNASQAGQSISNQSLAAPPASVLRSLPDAPTASPTTHLETFVDALARGPFGGWFLKLWLIVAALLLSREAIGHFRLARARRGWPAASLTVKEALAWPNQVPLYIHEHAGPSTVGLLRPAIVLPDYLWGSLPHAAVARIARHELAHARWRDPLINALLRLLCAALWPSAPLWFLERIIRAEREAAADRAALSFGSSDAEANKIAADYAASLILVAGWPTRRTELHNFGSVGIQAPDGSSLEDRIRRMFDAASRPTRVQLALASIALLAGLCGMNLLPTAAQPAEPTSPAPALKESGHISSIAAKRVSAASDTLNSPAPKKETLPSVAILLGEESAEAVLPPSDHLPLTNLDTISSILKADEVDPRVNEETQEKSNSETSRPPAKSDDSALKAASSPDTSGKWKYLGNGLWQDPLGNRAPPSAPRPWKDLGNGFWDDGYGRRVPAQALPAWVYLGEGKWYTPKIGDWIKNIGQ